VYRKSKSGRYGLKIWVYSDTEKSYVLKLQVYTGTTGGKREVRQGKRVVMDLVERYCGSWRGVTLDDLFTSLALAEELFKKRTTILAPCAATDGRYHRNFFRTQKRKSIQEYLGLLITRLLFRTCHKRRRSVILLSTEIIAVT